MYKIIPDYPAYRISRNGSVHSLFKYKTSTISDEWRNVIPVLDSYSGYYLVTLCDGKGRRQNKRIHRLLMEAFVPNPENKAHVNHIDGNKKNNCLTNLEWATPKENAIHASAIGLCDERRKKTEVAVIQMDNDYNFIAEHVSIHQAGRVTNIAWQNISKVVRGIRPRAGGYRWEYK